MQEFVLIKLLTGSRVGKIKKAELKIGAIIVYYMLTGVMGLASATFYGANYKFREANIEYVLCESHGRSDCELDLGSSGNITAALYHQLQL